MSDYISRADAIEAWDKLSKRGRTEFDQVLMTLPSAETVSREEYEETDGVVTIEKQNAKSLTVLTPKGKKGINMIVRMDMTE